MVSIPGRGDTLASPAAAAPRCRTAFYPV